MQYHQKKLIYSAVTIFLPLMFVSVTSHATALQLSPGLNKAELKLIDPWTIRCSNVEKLVDKKLDNFDNKKTKHYEKYIQLKERLTEKVNAWEDRGYDVDKLKEDLTTLENKIKEFTSDYNTYIDKLKATKNFTCGKSEGDFANALKEAKTALKEVRKDVVDIKTFYWTTVRQDILDLKEQNISGTEE
jgi:DNA repair exonuclease SbcCD ATPase subunit